MTDKIPFREIVREYASEQRASQGDHPDELALANYAENLLPEDARESVSDHLIWCPECRETLAIIRIPHDPDRGDHPLVPTKSRQKSIDWRPHLVWAAVLLVAISGLLWLASPWRDTGHNLFQVVLSSMTTRGELEITVPPGFDHVAFQLDATVSPNDGPFVVEVIGPEKTMRIPALPGRGGRFDVSIPVARLDAGPVEVRLIAEADDARKIVVTYRGRVRLE